MYKSIYIYTILLSSFALAQDTLYSHRILLTFNEPMQRVELFNEANYTVFDSSLNEIEIYLVGIVEGDTAVVIYTEFLNYKTDYAVRVFNVRDTSDNIINLEKNTAWTYFGGFDPNEQQPYLIIR